MVWSVLARLPRLLWFSFVPHRSGPYPKLSLQRLVVMLAFWPIFLCYLIITSLCLCLDHLLFPGFKHVTISRPWMVIGIPRSGTTFLHRLLAGDQQHFTTMTLQQLIFAPSIVQRLIGLALSTLDRTLGAPVHTLLVRLQRQLFAGLDGIHSTGLEQPEEDYLGLIPALHCFLLILPFGDPALMRLAYFDRDASAQERDSLMRYYRRLVQRHLYVQKHWHKSEATYLCKNPSFTPLFQTLATAFPDARFIACLRTPDQAVPSQVSSILIGARMFSGSVNKAWWCDNLVAMLRFYYSHLLSNLSDVGPDRHGFVRMEQLAGAPSATVTALYKRFHLPLTEHYRRWLAEEDTQAKAYRSAHHYRGSALGISAQDLCVRFEFVYRDLGYPQPEQFET
ncbi:sulfotransferase family protein [Ketobacter nezhaii]|uniref:sulfotransferase family protein n=1 Tax=Ketobacter sp. MCCC 1A13808 TaxID=2602738 RepID=UPI0018DE73C2|nr:sulfotransferase [Ketobacter sp. MCCC 1A13808]